jgi:hypothetical protein
MDLDGVFALILFVVHWRVSICLVCSTVLAVVLVNVFPWLTGFQGVVVGLLGLIPGALWEAEVTPQPNKSAKPAGSAWGASSSNSAHSFFAGAIIFAIAVWGWSCYPGNLQPPMPRARVLFYAVLAAVAYPIAALVVANAL